MSEHIRAHLRTNVVGYIALFCFAMSGTALATHPGGANTISTVDIINGQVLTADLAADSVNGGKLRNDSTASRHVVNNTLESEDVLDGTLTGADVAADSLAAADLAPDSVGFSEIDAAAFFSGDISESGGQFQVTSGGIDSSDLGDNSVGSAEIQDGAVNAVEIGDGIIARPDATPTLAPGGAAENGAYTVVTSTAGCNAGEQLISGTAEWTPDDQAANDYELWISEVRLGHGGETVSVDGGNDSGADHSLVAVAHCLQ